jgi:membrane protein required for beta-lactamase induction
MNFVGIVLALLLERALGQVPAWGEPELLRGALTRARQALPLPALWDAAFLPFLIALAPAWLVFWIHDSLAHPLYEAAFSAAVLLLCLGPRDLATDIRRWIAAQEAGDSAAAESLWRGLMRGPEPDPSHRTVLGALFIQSHERLFGVLLWFFVLGPAGAVLYRLISRLPRLLHEQSRDSRAAQAAEALHGLLAWAPARVTALVYGLAGSLDDALVAWRRLETEPHEWRSHTWAILAEVPAGSLSMEEPDGSPIVPANLQATVDEVVRMQFRSLCLMLAAFALFTTGSIV